MKPLSRLESLIAEIVERPAWALSSRRLNPLELTAALTKGMESRAVRLVDRVLAPDSYELSLNPADFAALQDSAGLLERELGDYLERLIAERDLTANGRPQVHIAAGHQVRAGRVQVTARFTPTASGTARVDAEDRATIVDRGGRRDRTPPVDAGAARPSETGRPGTASLQIIGPDGAVIRSLSLQQAAITIGRRSSCDLPLFDTKVSREHARVERTASGFAVVDLDSLNGTFVNGEQVRGSRPLRDGDEIEVGRHRLRFVI